MRRESLIPNINHSTSSKKTYKSKLSKQENTTSHYPKLQPHSNIINPVEKKTKSISYFKMTPVSKELSLRLSSPLPEVLNNRPKIVGNDKQIEALYSMTKTIALKYFTKEIFGFLFPDYLNPHDSRLSFMSNSSSRSSIVSASSQIPVFRKSSIANLPTKQNSIQRDLSFSSAFRHLSKALESSHTSMLNLIDFCLYYPSLILSLYGIDAAKNSLSFLTKVFSNDFSCHKGCNILFSVLLHVPDSAPELFENVSTILARMSVLEPSLVNRLKNGSTHHDPHIFSLCNDVLKRIGQKPGVTEIFTEIKSNVDEASAIKSLASYVQLLEDNGQPSDVLQFITNIVSVMSTFPSSSSVLTKASSCISSIVQFCPNCPKELVFEILVLSYSILLNEYTIIGGDPFEISDSIQGLVEAVFTYVEPLFLLPAISDLVSQASQKKLDLIFCQLGPYLKRKHEQIDEEILQKISENLIVFHPEYGMAIKKETTTIKWPNFLPYPETEQVELKQKSSCELGHSIERLLNEDTIFDEILTLVESSSDGSFPQYPTTIQSILQYAWMIIRKESPVNMSNNDIKEVIEMMEEIEDPEKFEKKFSPDALMTELETIAYNDVSQSNV